MTDKKLILIGSLLLLVFSFLNGCSTVKKEDGPPAYNVDVSNIPNAKPKVEPLSKYGNLPVYRVFGKKYYVMRSSKNYQARGTASWYGTKFHQHRTSSGERYDMLAMTAAHKTLPLPTYVQVTNLANGLNIIVKVNDRGPFEADRLIDLSYTAAKKLNMLGHGTAHVEIKAIDPSGYNKNYTKNEIHLNHAFLSKNTHPLIVKSHYQLVAHHPVMVYLQVGAFHHKASAEKLKIRLQSLIAQPIKITRLANHQPVYHVQIGPIKNPATIALITQKLKAIGISNYFKLIQKT